jgi:probable HAF family extracellular repeat protein
LTDDDGASSNGGGTITDLGTLSGGSSSLATAVNNTGQAAGSSKVPPNATAVEHGFLWSARVMTDLGTLSNGRSSHARGITNPTNTRPAPGRRRRHDSVFGNDSSNYERNAKAAVQRTSGRRIVEFDAQTGLLRLTNQGATRLVVPGQGAIEVAAADTLLLDPLTGDGVSHEVHGRDTSVDVVALICALLSG